MFAPGLSPEEKKRRAAEAAMSYIADGMLLGVGTGSTVGEFIEVLKARLVSRNTESPEVVERRLRRAEMEMSMAGEYDWIVVNDDLEKKPAEVDPDWATQARAEHDAWRAAPRSWATCPTI